MIVQVNTDHNTPGSQSLTDFITTSLEGELGHFSDHITRVEVHLSDENGGKTGQNDKKCTIEARLEHRQPIAVTSFADGYEESISGSIDKLKSTLDTIIGKMTSR